MVKSCDRLGSMHLVIVLPRAPLSIATLDSGSTTVCRNASEIHTKGTIYFATSHHKQRNLDGTLELRTSGESFETNNCDHQWARTASRRQVPPDSIKFTDMKQLRSHFLCYRQLAYRSGGPDYLHSGVLESCISF